MCKQNVVGEKCDKCKQGFVAGPNGTLDKDNQICFKAGMSYIILIEVKCIHYLILIFRYKVISVRMVAQNLWNEWLRMVANNFESFYYFEFLLEPLIMYAFDFSEDKRFA